MFIKLFIMFWLCPGSLIGLYPMSKGRTEKEQIALFITSTSIAALAITLIVYFI